MKNTYETKPVKIESLITENLQIRVEMQEECVQDYAAIYREDQKILPPVTVFYDVMGDACYLADGFHRIIAAKRAGLETVLAQVHEGTFNDALKFALKANDKHGIRRTNADKHNALEIAWQNRSKLFGEEKPTVRQLADVCAVSHGYAGTFLQNIGLSKLDKMDDVDLPDTPQETTPDALTVTNEHFEERNESIRELLKQGKDRYGMEIPEKIKPAFRSREPRIVMRNLGRIRNFLEKKRLGGDLAFAHSVGDTMRDLDAAIRDLRQGAVHCVCRMCRGRGCGACSDLGFQTRLQYGRVPPEYRAENK